MPIRRWLTAALLLGLSPFAYGEMFNDPACTEPACGEDVFHESWADEACEGCAPLWTFRAGAIYLDRSSPTDGAPRFQFPASPNFAPQLGFDFDARRRLNDCHFVEVRYFGVNDFSAIDGTVQPGFLVARYDSELQSAELNLYRDSQAWWSVLAGFRYVAFDERVVDDISFLGVPIFSFDNVTTNRLYGGQVGLEALLLQRGRVSLDGYVKAGVYYNDAGLSNSIAFVGAPIVFNAVGTNHTAFVGDVGVTGVFQWTERIALRGGLQLLWLEGVAEAGNQGFVGVDPIDTSGRVFYYGGTGAVEVKF